MTPPAPSSPRGIRLDYFDPAAQPAAPRWPRALLLAGWSCGVVAAFVAFTYGVSPSAAVIEITMSAIDGRILYLMDTTLLLIALPFFLAIPICLWQLRLLINGRIAPAERFISLTLSGLCAALTLEFVAMSVIEQGRFGNSLIALVIGSVVLLDGAVAMWWLRRHKGSQEELVDVALCTAYLANAGLCLVAFAGDRDPGWWLTIVAVGTAVIELALLLVPASFPRFNRRLNHPL